ncbi:PREDICTED: stem-specific protein TSJT1-like [Ipomoea nil]|uniref:stem-specific protein TSJT1-like n=1 Tax=Ipomoea nil TaxID=35883 RepID=UPI000901ECE0|nr:PREDICTED: stem-specific protein TSJT1-like [Ipomoea nil]
MLAIFQKELVNPPKELSSPASLGSSMKVVPPQEAINNFLSANPSNGFSLGFGDKAFLAYSSAQPCSNLVQQRLFCGVNDMYCIFLGSLHNLCSLNRQYGLSKGANEAMLVTQAYQTLRDRGPYPAHQVLKDLEGSFGFVIFDHKAGTVFAALGANESVKLYWGIAEDGSIMISDNVALMKASCAKSFAPFPHGCMYHSERGLMSFEHPMKQMKAMARVDSEGAMCGADFKVDHYSKVVNTIMPRVGSEANWTL